MIVYLNKNKGYYAGCGTPQNHLAKTGLRIVEVKANGTHPAPKQPEPQPEPQPDKKPFWGIF